MQITGSVLYFTADTITVKRFLWDEDTVLVPCTVLMLEHFLSLYCFWIHMFSIDAFGLT